MICTINHDSNLNETYIGCESTEAAALRSAKQHAKGLEVIRAEMIYGTLWDYMQAQQLQLPGQEDSFNAEIEAMQLEFFKASRKSKLLLELSEQGYNLNDVYVKANPKANGEAGYDFQLYTKTFDKDAEVFRRAELPLSDTDEREIEELMKPFGTQYGNLPYFYVPGNLINNGNDANPGREVSSIGFSLANQTLDYAEGLKSPETDFFAP